MNQLACTIRLHEIQDYHHYHSDTCSLYEDVTIQFDTQETLSCRPTTISNIMFFYITQNNLKLSPNVHWDALNTLTRSKLRCDVLLLINSSNNSAVDDRERRLLTVTNSEYERQTFIFRFQNQISDLDSRFKFQI